MKAVKTIMLAVILVLGARAQDTTKAKTKTEGRAHGIKVTDEDKKLWKWTGVLSPEFSKAAVTYLVTVKNFEAAATEGPIRIAKARIESAKEDMQAAATGDVVSPDNLTASLLEVFAMIHVTEVETYHLSPKPELRTKLGQNDTCMFAWKQALQKRDATEPSLCSKTPE